MNMKKLVSLVLALVMVMAMSAVAFAAPTNTTISVAAGDDRTYEVYQIFVGELSGNTLSNVTWGQNGTGEAGTAVDATILNELTAKNSASDTEKLALIEKYVNLNSTALGTVTAGSDLTVPTGYYLIKEVGTLEEGEAYSLNVVQIVGPITIEAKRGTVESDKKVKDKNDSTNTTTDWQDSADYDIGDEIEYKLSATLPNDFATYKVYKLTFHDTLSEGLTFDPNSVVVKIGDVTLTAGTDYELITTGLTDDCTFEVKFSDLKQVEAAAANATITVEYKATLNENAKIGSEGNSNTSKVTYSNNPNDEQGGENGETPDDEVVVFTYKLIINKVNQNEEPLTGAGFTLYKKNAAGEYVAVGSEIKGDSLTTFEWKGLDDGEYKLVETTTPAGYNTIADIEFTITAEHDTESDDPKLTKLETTFVSATVDQNAGSITGTVKNQAGNILPETGGMGTTMMYIGGGLLVAFAVIMLVTKRRMNAAE